MYNSDLAAQRYQHLLNQTGRPIFPAQYGLDDSFISSLHATRDPWDIQRASIVKGIDIDGKEIDCHPDSLAAFKKKCHTYVEAMKPKDLPTRYAESKESINTDTSGVIAEHRRDVAATVEVLEDNVADCAATLVWDSLETIKTKVDLSPKESLHILQVLNDVVELTAHTVSEFEEIFDDLGVLKNNRDIVTDAFEEAGKQIDAYITKLWGEINT